MQDRNKPQLSHQTRGILLMLAAVPLMVFIKWYFEDQVLLGVLAAGLLGWGALELGKNDEGRTD